jgi:hypothetical protein
VLLVVAVGGCGKASSSTTNLTAPPGSQYRSGELCPHAYLNKSTTGADGKLVCQKVGTLDRWVKS